MDAAKKYLNDAKTLKQSLIRALSLYSYRELSDDGATYFDFHRDVAKWAHIIRSKTKEFPEKTVAIIGECRLSWVLAEFACTFSRRATVGIHTEWPQSEIEYILSNADAGLLIILEVSRDVERVARDSAAAMGICVISLSDDIPSLSVEALCSPHDMIPMPSDMELANEAEEEADCTQLFSIMYTSGTTGRPKGVPVLRGLWRKNSIDGPGGNSAKPRIIVYNNLAHGSDRGRIWQTCMAGGKISFSSESNLIDDIIGRKPTNLFAFGNFWNEFYLRCMNDSDLRQKMGTVAPHVELIATGGTFTLPAALQYLKKLFPSARIIDSYGTTEAPGISTDGNFVDGGYDLKLVDVPSQNYFVAEGFGEIVVRDRGKYATRSYWKDPAATAAAWDSDGWYATGDIGHMKEDKLIIVGRRSTLVELYVDGRSVWVSSSKLEDEIFVQSDLVSNIFIWGDRMNGFLVAVVIPSSDKATTKSLLADFKAIGNSKGLHPWEIPSAVIVLSYGTHWSSSNGLLTSTGKLKRNALYAIYQEQITKLCADITGVSSVSDTSMVSILQVPVSVPVPAPAQSKLSETDCEHVPDTRVWQNQDISGITDYLDFKFKATDSDQAQEMNGVKEKLDFLVRCIRPYLKEIDAIYAAKYTQVGDGVGRNSEISEKLVTAILSVKEKGPALDSAIENWFSHQSLRLLEIRRANLQEAELSSEKAWDIANNPLIAEYRSHHALLRDLSLKYRISIPAYIGFDYWIKEPDPTSTGDEGVNFGGEQNIVWCSMTGKQIQATESDAGVPRYVSLQNDLLVYSAEAYDELRSISNHIDMLKDEDAKVKLAKFDRLSNHLYCCEKNTPFFCSTTNRPTGRKSPKFLFLRSCESFSTRPALGQPLEWPDVHQLSSISHRDYRWATYRDLHTAALKIARGLRQLASRGAHVAICGFNTFEWAVCDFACAIAGLVSVGIHSNYDAAEATNVLNHADIEIIVLSKAFFVTSTDSTSDRRFQTSWMLQEVLPNVACVKAVVSMDTAPDEAALLFTQNQYLFSSFSKPITFDSFAHMLVSQEASEICEQEEDDPNALFTLLYTSGSSGKPKAVEQSESAFYNDNSRPTFNSHLVTVSYIPLSHSSDRYKMWNFLYNGGRVGFAFYSAKHWVAHEKMKKDAILRNHSPEAEFGGVFELFQYISKVQPLALSLPPNIWDNLYSLSKSNTLAEDQSSADQIIRSWFGPFIKQITTGGAPSRPEVLAWARRMLFPIFVDDSYGITEIGEVCKNGKPTSDVEVRLVDIPELGLCHPFGEIWVLKSSDKRSRGYYKDEAITADSFTTDGWYKTGDVGQADNACGTLTYKIIDRINAVYGMNVDGKRTLLSPFTIEDAVVQGDASIINFNDGEVQTLVDCFIHVPVADQVVAVLVVRPFNSFDCIKDSSLSDHYALAWLEKMKQKLSESCAIRAHEIPTRVMLTSEEFSVENGLLTPSFKKARKLIINKFFR